MSELNANLGRILIVDDDQDLLELLQILLQREGFRVDICSDLAAMRALVTQYSFEGILLDLFLGE
ncbi:MAG: response regulator [Proteobacteria bacterium]|nr:response regulator [Pseudomonadota bacterium]